MVYAVRSAPSDVDVAEFRRIFDAELGYVWGTLRRLGVGPADVEDVAHDVFLQVYDKLAVYDRTRPLRPWLFGFAFRAASGYRRGHKREAIGEPPDVAANVEPADETLALGVSDLFSLDMRSKLPHY